MPQVKDNAGTEQSLPPTAPVAELKAVGLPERPVVSDDVLRDRAAHLAKQMQWVQPAQPAADLEARLTTLKIRLDRRLRLCKGLVTSQELTPALELLESGRMFEAVLTGLSASRRQFQKVPYVRVPEGAVPRVLNLAEGYIAAAGGIWSLESLVLYTAVVQRRDPLLLAEVLLLPGSLKLAQLEFVLDRADEAFAAAPMPSIEDSPFSAPIHSLRRLNQFEWQLLLEEIVAFNRVLAQDPAGAYARMEEENRASYRQRVAELAQDSDCSEIELAQVTLQMAREAAGRPASNPRLAQRMSHVGYYLFEEGFEELSRRVGYHAPAKERLRNLLRKHNVDIYIFGIYVLSIGLIAAFIAPLVPHHEFLPVMGTLLLALLPATQGASDLVNNAVSALLTPRALPKLDLSKGIPEELSTLVVVPTLLLSEAQIREIFEDLEARYLSNHDPHLHFGLLTDLPDSVERPQPGDRSSLVELALRLTDELNAKYGGAKAGCFLLLHRHRVFNTRQGVWMGWERKRGKLLDLNKLLLGEFDSYAVKAGPTPILQKVRYVITLDSDTQLPRGTAARMIGAIAHPLNQAIVDPRRRIVTAGYGILQPRVGVSVSSASRSRLATLYSGETGYDIYTRAVSDVYQDLFGEGIFTGKGIYEVATLHQVLDRRFPRNALLSHDLIEGAYARVGLATDIEVIDDYPSHYSAHTRRRHRWVRGDWQITQWLFSRVPDELGRSVVNPISTISRWKIFDNLRRSLIEPITFLLLVSGWLFLPGGALYWTIVTLSLMLVPVFVQLGFNLGRAGLELSPAAVTDSFRTFFAALGFHMLTLAFIPHQTLLSLDAITRSLVRRFVTGKRLLEWETAAQAEAGKTRSTLDLYLQICPLVALGLAGILAPLHYRSLLVAGPILLLWALAPAIAGWLDSPPRKAAGMLAAREQRFLERQALLIWRYFAEFGGAENHWLIPDNVEEKGLHKVLKLSPTNLGMLLNARQAALRLDFLTLPEFAQATLNTLTTYDQLEKQRGHIYNWYNIETLQPIPPLIVSTVDSGNLAAALYALHGGALELLKRPLLEVKSFASLVRMAQPAGKSKTQAAQSGESAEGLREAVGWLMRWNESEPTDTQRPAKSWEDEETVRRREAMTSFVGACMPWLLPRFTPLFGVMQFHDPDNEVVPTLEDAVEYVRGMDRRLGDLAVSAPDGTQERELSIALRGLIPDAIAYITQLTDDVRRIAQEAERHADAMRYDFLFVESRQLLAIGFDGQAGETLSACYDLLASEARIASFLAVASGDIPQKAWFRLDRTHSLVKRRAALLSWTGTMFEYMMPTLWMRNYPDTLISRSLESTVAIQRLHVRGIPWGISESGFAKTDPQGRYGYQAWGIPDLALKYGAEDGPVISPYSTFLALPFAREEALANLHRMADLGWVGSFGFYEAADYGDYIDADAPQLVRSWMAHHQGMSLLAITNLLCGNIFQEWFHANPKVRAAELLLHERPLSRQTLKNLQTRSVSSVSSENSDGVKPE